MRRILLITLVLVTPLLVASCAVKKPVPAAAGAATEIAPRAATPFEGKWREVKNQAAAVGGNKTWGFTGNTLTIREGDKTFSGTFTVDGTRSPREIDIQFDGYPVNKAIYELNGDMLTIKVLDSSVERASKMGIENGYIQIICSKIKE